MHFKDYELEEILQNKKAQLIKLNNENKEKDDALYKLAKENSYNALLNMLKTMVNEYDKKHNHNDILSINLYYNETIKIINNDRLYYPITFDYEDKLNDDIESYNSRHYLDSIVYAAVEIIPNESKRYTLKPMFIEPILNYFENLGFTFERQPIIGFSASIANSYTISITKEKFGEIIMRDTLIDELEVMFENTRKEKEEYLKPLDIDIIEEINRQTDEVIKLLVQSQIEEYKGCISMSISSVHNNCFLINYINESKEKTNIMTLKNKAVEYNKYFVNHQIREIEFDDKKFLVFVNKLYKILNQLGTIRRSEVWSTKEKDVYCFSMSREKIEEYIEKPNTLKLKLGGNNENK